MKIISKVLIITILSSAGSLTSRAQNKITNIDLSFQYRVNSPFRGEIISSKSDSSALLFIKFNSPLDSLEKYKIGYSLVNSLDEEITTRVELNGIEGYFQFEDASGSQYGIRTKVNDSKYFILWLIDTARNIKYPYVKYLHRNYRAEDILLKQEKINTPIFQSFLTLNSNVKAVSLSSYLKDIKVDYYDYDFSPASPPMSTPHDSLAAPFIIDNTFALLSDNNIQLRDKGLYYFHLGESEIGKSIIIRESPYPKISNIERLVETLRYLATEEEYIKMASSFNKKELFDQFWLNNTKSEAKARRSIKEYYMRVKEANILFTTYKEGWKTDMGMIYIIYGPPSKVFVRDSGVMWIYPKTFELPRVAFFFNHINTAFSDQHYVLERKLEFQNLWFRTVDLWRSGRKEF